MQPEWKKAIFVLVLLGVIFSISLYVYAEEIEKIPVWQLQQDGNWEYLGENNDSATCKRLDPYSYYCNAGRQIPVKVTCEVHCDKFFTKDASAVTGTTELESGVFTAIVKQYAEWNITIRVVNDMQEPMLGAIVKDTFPAEVEVDLSSVSPGTVDIDAKGHGKMGATKITWDIGDLSTGSTAVLVLRVYTRENPGGQQEFTSPGTYDLNEGVTLTYTQGGDEFTEKTSGIVVHAVEADNGANSPRMSGNSLNNENGNNSCTISFSASSFNWYIRKSGIFAAGPIVMNFNATNDMQVGLQFSGFNDLNSTTSNASVATWYGFGIYGETPDFYDVSEWIPAEQLNQETEWPVVNIPGTQSEWSMWCRIEVENKDSAGEYSGGGTITFVVQP